MRRGSVFLLLVSLCGGLSCVPRVPGSQGAPGTVDFSLARQGGGTYRLSQDRGHVVLIDVWATWCEPCRRTLPIVENVACKQESKGVRAYALNVDADGRRVPAFLKQTGLGLAVLLDPEAEVVENVLGVREMPTTVLIDGRGMIRFRHEGAKPGLGEALKREIDQLLVEGGAP